MHDQLVGSKVPKYLERLLNRPPFPGVEMAAAQLLMDWAFLYGWVLLHVFELHTACAVLSLCRVLCWQQGPSNLC